MAGVRVGGLLARLFHAYFLRFEQPVDLLNESEELHRVLLLDGLLTKNLPPFFILALHGASDIQGTKGALRYTRTFAGAVEYMPCERLGLTCCDTQAFARIL